MSAETPPQPPIDQEELPVFFAPRAFEMFRQVAYAIHHNAAVLGGLALAINDEFGQRYGLRAPIENSVLTYRFGVAGLGQPKAEPHIQRAAPGTPYHDASQLTHTRPDYIGPDAYTVTSRERVLALGTPIDIWTGATIQQPLLRRYLEALLYPPPENESGLVRTMAWMQAAEDAFSSLRTFGRTSPKRKEAFILSALRQYSSAITLDLR